MWGHGTLARGFLAFGGCTRDIVQPILLVTSYIAHGTPQARLSLAGSRARQGFSLNFRVAHWLGLRRHCLKSLHPKVCDLPCVPGAGSSDPVGFTMSVKANFARGTSNSFAHVWKTDAIYGFMMSTIGRLLCSQARTYPGRHASAHRLPSVAWAATT